MSQDGLAIVGATGEVAPADKKIYALRDVTDTVDSIPLIASSIMSKKIASGTDALVIDVKTGAGAFMKTLDDSRALAKALVTIGQQVGLDCNAIISDMNQPLGNKIGNALEIEETIDLLKGQGPADLLELVLTLGSYMAVMGGKAADLEQGRAKLSQTIEDGSALAKFKQLVIDQGGDARVIEDYTVMPQAKYKIAYQANRSGVLAKLTADEIGKAAMVLGGGRQQAEDQLDYAVGIELHKKLGDPVETGEPILTIYSNQPEIQDALALLDDGIEIADQVEVPDLIHEVIE